MYQIRWVIDRHTKLMFPNSKPLQSLRPQTHNKSHNQQNPPISYLCTATEPYHCGENGHDKQQQHIALANASAVVHQQDESQ